MLKNVDDVQAANQQIPNHQLSAISYLSSTFPIEVARIFSQVSRVLVGRLVG